MKGTNETGFTLVEIIVAVAIIAVLCISIYGFFTAMLNGIIYYRERITISALADQYLEIARNLPYSQIGTVNGNPSGSLPDLPNATNVSFNGNNYQIYYAVSYVDDPADGTILAGTDPAPDDYKQVKVYVKNVATGATNSFLTEIVPKGLEGLASGGALSLKVFNAIGLPVPGATIHITNTAVTPNINLTRTADANGNWIEVGLADSANSYHITATKIGYSSDQTYPSSTQNPDPTKPDATISNGQVTQISFSIDQLSNLTFSTLDQTCNPLPSVAMEVKGIKLIGTPSILKFDNNYTSDSNGQVAIPNIEWDNYTPALTGSTYMIYGTSPVQPAVILPGTTQNFMLILGPKTSNSLLVVVKDSATQNPVEGASVELQNTSPAVDTSKITGGSVWSQQDWSDADGVNVDDSEIPSGLRLLKSGSSYVSSGSLTSSIFDTGTNATSYTTLNWQPTSQDPATSIKFQVASNNDDLTWNYLGPDGTSSTFYTTPGSAISSANNNNRYIRYKVFLSTQDSSKTPVLTSVNLNYVSGCHTPGQVIFPGLAGSKTYQIAVSAPGYQEKIISNIDVNGYQVSQVSLDH